MKDLLRTALICAIISAVVAYWISDDETHTSMFCAYGKVFVTFKEHRTVWGTMLLDDHGVPIPCDDPDIKEESKYLKGSI